MFRREILPQLYLATGEASSCSEAMENKITEPGGFSPFFAKFQYSHRVRDDTE